MQQELGITIETGEFTKRLNVWTTTLSVCLLAVPKMIWMTECTPFVKYGKGWKVRPLKSQRLDMKRINLSTQ